MGTDQILPSLAAQAVVKTESSPSIVAKSLHSPAGGFSPVGLPPVGLPPVGLSGFPVSGQPSSGHASHVPSSLLKAEVSSSPFTHLLLADPFAMKPSAHLSIHVSFLHLTLPFSTAAGSGHFVH